MYNVCPRGGQGCCGTRAVTPAEQNHTGELAQKSPSGQTGQSAGWASLLWLLLWISCFLSSLMFQFRHQLCRAFHCCCSFQIYMLSLPHSPCHHVRPSSLWLWWTGPGVIIWHRGLALTPDAAELNNKHIGNSLQRIRPPNTHMLLFYLWHLKLEKSTENKILH